MNIGEIRSYVRAQLDVDEEEYPNALLDTYIAEAFSRTTSLEPRWPTYESVWELVKADETSTITPPENLNIACIDSLVHKETGARLLEISPHQAEDYLMAPGLAGVTHGWFTTYGGVITLWPQDLTSDEEIYVLRGQRTPVQPTTTDSDVLDIDPRLTHCITAYVIALMYANQEDEVLEDVYMKRWQANFGAARRAIFSARASQPIIYSGGLRLQRSTFGYPPVTWDI